MNNTHKYNLVFKTKISDSGEIKLKKDISKTDIECEKCGMASCDDL